LMGSARKGSMSRGQRWHKAICSDYLKRYDMEAVTPEPIDAKGAAALPRSLPKAMYDMRAGECSLGHQHLMSCAASSRSWPSPTPLAFNVIPMATRLMLELAADGMAVSKVKYAWRSLAAAPGMAIRHLERRQLVYVIHSCQYGCLGWAMQSIRIGAERGFAMQLKAYALLIMCYSG